MSLRTRLSLVKEGLERISGDWNGEDSTFMSEGVNYTEDQAHAASEGAELIDKLLPILEELHYD